MSEYDKVIPGSLHLRKNQGVKKRKHKHKKSATVSNVEESEVVADAEEKEVDAVPKDKPKNGAHIYMTKAEREWERRRDKRVLETVLSKADKSHKQRIIEFNNYLSTLTEHFDIQKVSWTK
ncbi:unnamed protein product [Calicophoron daubneyi]|uniref:Protein FAM32A n=1 Tax=Calicophoron daubneyi TaxID=300641 RepID=A0AAV2SYX0_CALDB